MNEVNLKIEKLCNKLEYIVKHSDEISVDRGVLCNNIYRIYSDDLYDYIFSIVFIKNKNAYFIKVNNNDSSNNLGIFVDADNKNAKKIMELVKDKYKNQQDKEKEMIEKIDKSLEILDRINDRIFKEE